MERQFGRVNKLKVTRNEMLMDHDEKKEISIILDYKNNSAKILEDGYTLCKLGLKKIGNTFEFM